MEVTLLGRKFIIRPEALDTDGKNWDEKILSEVINGDCYQLRNFKDSNPNAKLFIDIGANIGAFSVFVKSLWPDANVICAEPLNNNFDLLAINTAGLSSVSLVNKAIIGTKEREVGFNAPTLISRVRRGFYNSGDGFVNRNVHTKVMSCQISELIDIYNKIDFMKIDCEGSEGEIIESIAGTDEIKKIKYINGEWHGDAMANRLEKALKETHEFKVTKCIFADLGTFEAKRIEDAKSSSVS